MSTEDKTLPENAGDKPSEVKAAAPAKAPTTPAASAAAAPAAKPAEKAPEPAAPPSIGLYGKMLQDNGIEAKPLPESTGVETLELNAAQLPKAIKYLRETASPKLDFLVTVSGVDSADTFDSVYHLWSYRNLNELVVKVCSAKTSVPADKLPEVPSIASYWPTADWHERETYDLVGIRYIGHRYLRRILNPWDWEGHPLRRDYKQPVDALNDKNPDSMR